MAAPNFEQLAFEVGSVFTPGSPINERDLFAGRVNQLREILHAISQRGYHAVLYGERGVGKTSLSNVLSAFLGDMGRAYLVPRVNCDASDTYSTLWRKALNDIVVTKSRPALGFRTDDIEEAHRIVDTLPNHLTPDDVRRVLTDLSRGIILVVVFDEFDRLKDRGITTLIADTIKSLSDHAVPATVLLIGVADSIDQLIDSHQSIERALVQIPMPRMSTEEVVQIIANGMSRLALKIDREATDELVALSQGLPYVTHLLALNSTRSALTDKRLTVSTSDVQSGIRQALEQWQQSTKSGYYAATKSQQPGAIYREVLLACSLADVDDLGYFAAAAVRSPLRVITGKTYEIPNYARHLKEFSDPSRGGVLERYGETRRVRYRFASPLMRPYVIMRAFDEGLLNKQSLQEIIRG